MMQHLRLIPLCHALLGLLFVCGPALPAKASTSAAATLFDGSSLAGWQHVGDGRFVLENGLLKTEGGMGLLWYNPRAFFDVDIEVEYRFEHSRDNSGVFIRIPSPPSEPWMPVYKGYEVQIQDGEDASAWHRTGSLYSLTEARTTPGKVGVWNHLKIRLEATRTRVWVNQILVTDFREGDPVPPKKQWYEPERGPRAAGGYIGLQNHGAESTVYFRSVRVSPIPEESQP